MEEDMDDFGDIYADVEGFPNAGISMIPSIRQLYLEDQASAEQSPEDSEEEERLLYDRIGRGGLPDGSPASAAVEVSDGSAGKPPAEGDAMVGEESHDSDSDDGLRIVLNDEDCSKFVPPPRGGLGNGGLLAGAGTNGEAEDESIIGNGGEHMTKEHKCADLLQVPAEGLDQSSLALERGGSLKTGFVMPYSQYKYIRSQSAGRLNDTKSTGQGYAVPFTSPMTSRGDRDVSGLLADASCHFGFPVPRNRTIFDISIESFDWKPWRNQGIDITDFFNFGLNEESWKQYCHDMVLFRKQATWVARNSIYGAIGLGQVCDAGSLHGVASSLSKIHLGGGTAASVVAKPKGRAIEVEGGSGERLPSVDIRRPRYQDSDVVIQIPVEYTGKDAKMSTTPLDGHRNEEAVDFDKRKQPESRSTILRQGEKVQNPPDLKGIDNEKPREIDAQVFGTYFASEDVPRSSCPSSPERISEASEGDFSADKLQSPAKRSSLGSVAVSDISVGSSCDTSHQKRVNDGADSQVPNLCLEEQKKQSDTELCDVVEADTESTDMEKKGKHSSDSSRRYSRKLGKRSKCNHHGGENPSSYKTKISRYSRSWRVAEKWLTKSSHTEHSHRNEFDPFSRGDCHGKLNPRERRDCRHIDRKQTEHRTPIEDGHDWPMEFVIHKERYISSLPDHMPFGIENDQSIFHRSRTADEYRWCVKSDVISKDRYMKEYIEGSDLKHFPVYDSDEAFQEDFDRNGRDRSWDRRSSPRRRERYDRNVCIEMDDSQEYVEDDKLWRHSNHKFFDDKNFRGSHGRVWHESSPPRFYGHDSWKSNEMHVGHCGISSARETQFNRPSQWDPCNMDRFSSYRVHHEIDSHLCSIKEKSGHARNTLASEGRKSSHLSQRRHVTEDQASLRHQVLDDSYYPEAYFSRESVYRHESCYGEPSLKFFHSRSLVNENGNENGRRVPRKKGFVAKENYLWHGEAVDGCLSGYEGKPLEKSGDVLYKKKKIRDDKMEGFHHVDKISLRKGNPGKGQKVQDTQVIHSTVEKVDQRDSVYCGTHCNEEPDDPAVVQDHDDSGLEEGQLVELEDDDAATKATKADTEEAVSISCTGARHAHNEKNKQVKQASCNKEPIEYDKSHILETLAKMEKRRERFKEPIAPQKEHDNAQNILSKVKIVSEGVKLERPTRKRRWGAVKSSAA